MHTDNEYRADDHGNPGADEIGEIFLQRHHDIGANHRTEKSSAAAEQGHQNNFAGIGLTDIRQRDETQHQRP